MAWKVYEQRMIVGHNNVTLMGKSLDECKAACLNDSLCQSIEYRNTTTLCNLQHIQKAALAVQADFTTEASTDYYELTDCGTLVTTVM